MKNSFLLIQLNEINFDIVNKYLLNNKSKFTKFSTINDEYKKFITSSEIKYKNLEPWIQWPSIILGKKFKDHKIFRLGDIVNNPKQTQLLEKIEKKGFKVGSMASMNVENRLKKSAYFIPDPWTDTKSDSSSFSKRLTLMLKQTVNDNSSKKLSISSILTLAECVFRTFQYSRTFFLLRLILSSFRKPWVKALVLDYILHMTNLYLLKKKKPNFSSIFFNAGAHIQHHYLFNVKYINKVPKNPNWYIASTADPFADMLYVYNKIIGDYYDLSLKGSKVLIATALRQIPYDTTKFYYRLKNHQKFLNKIGINYSKLLPRMTRDFEIIFKSEKDLNNAIKIFKDIKLKKNNICIFNEIEKRKKSLFVTLTYPKEIKKSDYLIINKNLKINFYKEVVFVGIKNAMHDQKGYLFSSPNINVNLPSKKFHITKIHDLIIKQFNYK